MWFFYFFLLEFSVSAGDVWGEGGGNNSCPVPNKSVITNNIISDKYVS